MIAPEPDNAAAIDFLRKMYAEGPWVLTAIRADRKAIDTKTFRPSQEGALLEWLKQYNGERNIYWSVNPPLRDLSKKAEREDIKEVAYLHVDVDPRAGEDLTAERERLEALFSSDSTKLKQSNVPAPTAVLFSGGGYQAFWRLEVAIPVNGDLQLAEDAKRYNQQLELIFGGDNCHNIDRIMRLPGTINVPDEKKRKKGRTAQLSVLVSFTNETHALGKFTAASVVQTSKISSKVEIGDAAVRLNDIHELDKWKVPDRVKVICVQGRHPEEPKLGDNSRSAWVFDVCCQLHRCGVPDAVTFSILMDKQFGISESVIEKGGAAAKYAIRQIERAKEQAADPVIFEMNQHHAAISLGGKFRVMTLKPDLMYPSQMVAEFSTKDDFCNLYDHPRVLVDKKAVGRGKSFLDSPNREQFDGIEFEPGAPAIIEKTGRSGRVVRYANMYAGLAVEPANGHCELYLDHVRDNICNGDAALYEYVLNLMASGVQHPADPQRVALSMRGVPGTGKGVFATEYGKLFGRHFFHITNPAHLTGKFNAHAAEAMFLFADETLNLNDRRVAADMKTLISERTKMIERKGIDAFQAKNYARVWFSTNEEHPLMIEDNDRRYCAVHVNSRRAKDRQYFKAILAEMNNGGREALLHTLLVRDISEFNAEAIPQTAELVLQKLLSASPGDRVIISFAQEGHLPGALVDFGGHSKKKERPWIARSRELLDDMRRRAGRDLQQESEVMLTRILKSWGFKGKALGDCSGWEAPPLEKLRAAVAAKYPGVVWEQPELAAWGGVSADISSRQRKDARDNQQFIDQRDLDLKDEAPF